MENTNQRAKNIKPVLAYLSQSLRPLRHFLSKTLESFIFAEMSMAVAEFGVSVNPISAMGAH